MPSTDRSPARLVLQRPDGEAAVYALEPGESVTVGRDAGNTIVLASRFVSKRHALVSWTPEGVRIEDRDSVNGIAINGLTVQAAQLSSGDAVQIGDQHLVFEVTAQPAVAAPPGDSVAAAGGRRHVRSVLVVLPMLAVVGLAAVYVTLVAPAVKKVTRPSAALHEDPALASDTMITPFDSPQAQAVEQQAIAAKDTRPADRLFAEGEVAYANGRLLDAYLLLHGALLRDPQHEASRRLLLRVMGERQLRLNTLKAAATHADQELKFDEAARQWEAMQALTLDTEPLNARARTESARLRLRAAQ
jgi:hypothetical protein